MRKNVLLIGLLLIQILVYAQIDSITQRIVLIGDAGQLTNGKHPVVDAVKKNIPLDNKTTVLYLGDNLYRSGLPDVEVKNYYTSKAVLDTQLSVTDNTPAKLLMIPGNHDWENGKRGGYDAIIRQQLYVDFIKKSKSDIKFQPEDGCPGPVKVDLGKDVVLIIFDSQWWIHPHEKPEIESDCNCKTKEELVTQIGNLAAQNSKKLILIACHHPFKSNGPHGGFFLLKQHIFPFTDLRKNLYIPLPVLGSAYPVARSVFGSPQDISHPDYTNMVERITKAVKTFAKNVVFVSGHDHNLQLIKEDGYNYIVSGGGCKYNRSSKAKNSIYNNNDNGFVVMEVINNKNVNVKFFTVTDSLRKVYSNTILNFSASLQDGQENAAIPDEKTYDANKLDSIKMPASKFYPPVAGIKKYFMGQNYRKEWSVPVNMKVFHLENEKGGMSIINLGGGQQTRSLRLKDKDGKEWVLRSINKNPTSLSHENTYGNIKDEFVEEMNSAAHPYSAVIIPDLTNALEINAAKPEIVFVPDDPALGIYRPLFANTVCLLEIRNATKDGSETKTTAKVFSKMMEDNDHRPDQESVLKARLLDFVIGDFDRHFDQWRWGIIDTNEMKGRIYYPIPRDRDQAFFNPTGRIFRLVAGRDMPYLKGFRNNIKRVNWLGYTARDFDRIFLNKLTAEQWLTSAEQVQKSFTDSVMRSAVQKLPPEVFAISGETIITKLINRRNLLQKEATDYYNFLSKKVNVIGSNQKEYFKVSQIGNNLQVRVYEKGRKGDTSFIMYNRVFDPAVTKEIRLFGLNDEDVFEVEKDVSSSIKIRFIGGKGNDTFNIQGHLRNYLYDLNSDSNFIKNRSLSRNRFSDDPPANERSILGYKYNYNKFPQVQLGYNSDDGLMVGGGFSRRTYGYLNFPYATDQQLTALYSVTRKALQLRYRGEFNHIRGKTDLLIRAAYNNPVIMNFTGLGNKTTVPDGTNFDFYRIKYRSAEVEMLFRKRVFESLHLMAGPYYFHYGNDFNDNKSTILAKPRDLGFDSAGIFSKKNYAGAKFLMQFDNRNNQLFPTRGVLLTNELLYTFGIGDNSKKFTRYTMDMTMYISRKNPANMVVVLGFGGSKILSDTYEFFQAVNLGINNSNFHGFRKNRFSGRSTMYATAEIRKKLFNLNTYLIPGEAGLTAFYDVGRVWIRNQSSGKWHGAFGGGFYFIPFNKFMVTASAGFSENERLLNFSIGTRMNLVY